MMKRALPFVLVLILGVVLGGKLRVQVAVEPPVARSQPAARLSGDFADVSERVLPSVVRVDAVKVIPGYRHPFADDPLFQYFFRDDFFFTPERRVQTVGSGVVMRPDGYVITNNHVVDGVTEIRVSLYDGRKFPARLVGTDPASDLAVLKLVGAHDLPSASWGSSHQLRVGEWVLAYGSPFHLSASVTHGIVSAKGRKGLGITDYEDFIQTDAAINPGNSGGPLVNLKGQVVGINTAILSRSGGSHGVGLAIPAEVAREVMDTLIAEGRVDRGWLGLFVQTLTPERVRRLGLPLSQGVMVVGGYRRGPAARAGLELYDVIVRYGGQPVKDEETLRNRLARSRAGDTVTLGIWRKGRELEIPVTLQSRPVDRYGRPARGL